MSDAIIKVESVGKCYRLHHEARESYTTIRDVVSRRVRALLKPQTSKPKLQASDEDFWALKDLNFEIKQGEVVGIIGRNGAGKSTLLKILSRITEPTTGRITLRGRVASLLEVGTGFHPELTGRENIFLNGAILGMRKDEIKAKFDEIVAFAEVEKFLDTPVKRYSSGMYVRLAFAVAAHLEPEILVVDEVLAVGDAEFQKKCMGKMTQVARGGRTILFVSHNMAAVAALCTRAVLLRNGLVTMQAQPREAIAEYLRVDRASSSIAPPPSRSKPHFQHISLDRTHYNFGDIATLRVEAYSPHELKVGIELEIMDDQQQPIIYSSTSPMFGQLIPLKRMQVTVANIELGPILLAAGEYTIRFWLINPWVEVYDSITDDRISFSVDISDPGRAGFDFRQSYHRGCNHIPLKVLA